MRFNAIAVSLCLAYFCHASANSTCGDLFASSRFYRTHAVYLKERFDISDKEIQTTPRLKLPVVSRMDTHETLVPRLNPGVPLVREQKTYDVVIVGAGPAGLTAALYLAEAGKSVLILERNEQAGGLAMGSELKGVRAGGGAAYSAGPSDKFEYDIFRKIGLGQYKKKLTIAEPIDSYLWHGKLYKGIWEEHTLQELPASFALFKHALLALSKKGAGLETGALAEWADNMDMATLVRKMPELVRAERGTKARAIYERFTNDEKVPKEDPMQDVIDLLDLYGRSALGGTAKEISARQFIEFYESEIYTRYTGSLGTGTIAEALLKRLEKYRHLVEIRTSTPVAQMENTDKGGVRTVFMNGSVAKEVHSHHAIFAASVKSATKLIKDLEKTDPEKVDAINTIEMTDYAVHVVRMRNHAYRATYDTWSFGERDPSKPTDFILGRWQDTNGFAGMRDFTVHPKDDRGVITIYHPLGRSDANNFSTTQTLERVDAAVTDMVEKLAKQGTGIKLSDVELVETYRWPDSIHIVRPGYLRLVPVLARPTGQIRYANNSVSAPELESAMARGAREALMIIESENRADLPGKTAVGE